ncbi:MULTISPECIES: metal-dependent hydrolase [Halomonadaceae]|uniref:metal-dependent hydrolase n=1 Tax=Halomonadaceae TaxID=28256 RepID=UPI0015991133|nr:MULTISPECIES: metal-dependent hydrolase [Halomonas]QJQ94534.1 metal-dependent hydrolase [Halomonas sp. PA5]
MDSLTQAVLGAAVGGAVLGRRLGRKALLIGAALGTLPDLDVLIDYGDAVANFTEHRGFSHSLFVLSGLGTLLAALCSRFAPARDIPFRHWWLFFVLCLTTHPLLDALTTYGTQLWWPLEVHPSGWPVIFIIDPLYTLPLLVGVIVALFTGNGRRAPAWGLALSCAYLLFALGAKAVIESRLEPALAERGLDEAPRLVQPSPFNTLLWRVTLIEGDDHYEGLMGLFDGDAPLQLERFSRGAQWQEQALALPAGERLGWFAGPFLRYEVHDHGDTPALAATDLRLGFPGFHPFTFTLATRDEEGWQPQYTEQLELDSESRGDRDALTQLARRIFDAGRRLCLGEHVEARWHTEESC